MPSIGRPKKEDMPKLVTMNGNAIPIYELMEINPDHVDSYLCEQADWQALVGYQHGMSKVDVERCSNNVDDIESLVFSEHVSKSEKRTMETLRHLVNLDPRVKSAKTKLLVAKEREAALESIRWALQTRRDMLVQLNADIRAEKKLQ